MSQPSSNNIFPKDALFGYANSPGFIEVIRQMPDSDSILSDLAKVYKISYYEKDVEEEDCLVDILLIMYLFARTGNLEGLTHTINAIPITVSNSVVYSCVLTDSLSYAAKCGHLDIVNTLIGAGSAISDQALLFAINGGHLDIVNALIEAGVEIKECKNALRVAALNGYSAIVCRLIEAGATNYDIALSQAAHGGHLDVVNILIEAGATNYDNALEGAKVKCYQDVINRLIEVGASNNDKVL